MKRVVLCQRETFRVVQQVNVLGTLLLSLIFLATCVLSLATIIGLKTALINKAYLH